MESIMVFIGDLDVFFTGYDPFYSRSINVSDLANIEPEWFEFVNKDLFAGLFQTDLTSYFAPVSKEDSYQVAVDNKIAEILEGDGSSKDIGDLGENLIIGHEKVRLTNLGREDLIHLIKKIPTSLAVGYDIQSVEVNQLKRYIEVKTTISNRPIKFFDFHMTANEWNTATTLNDRYYVYRLMINKTQKIVYLLQNPVQMYRQAKINMTMTDGAEISFKEEVAEKMELLLWKK